MFLIIALLLSTPALALSEADHVRAHCTGQIEYVLPDRTRVDCLTDTHAIEYGWADNCYEDIGQALHYASHTGRRAGIVLIKKKPSDSKYVDRCNRIINHYGLPIDLEAIE